MNIWEMSRDGLVFLLKYVYRYGLCFVLHRKGNGIGC